MRLTRSLLKQYYVTTPIFYVNAAPHVGHLYSMVLADSIKRWHNLNDPKSGGFMLTGTDEHGMKVQSAAAAANLEPKVFVDKASLTFKNLADQAHLSYDRFIRTTDRDHCSSAQHLWKTLQDKGYIYKGQHSGWYSVSDETFYPESQLEKKDGVLVSIESGKPVEWFEEDNYFFALSKIQPKLLQFLKENTQFVIPNDKYKFIIKEVENGLTDLSISRPYTRCSWGIPVPNDETQVMYVWLEALANYLTAANYPEDIKDRWPADAHIVGKDIQRFHAIYWPAFLLAAELDTPKQIVVHSHWTIAGSKMSKSLGNVADPVEAMNSFGVEPVKFFLLHDGYLDHDSPYSPDRIISRHNTELVNRYGNLVMRVCGPKFNIERAVSSELDNPEENSEIEARVNELSTAVNTHMLNFDTPRALEHIWSLITDTNLYIQNKEPWKLGDKEQDKVIKDAAEVARVSSILLTAFIPEIANKVLDRLVVDRRYRTIDYAHYGKDKTYGKGANVKGNAPLKPL